MNWCQFKHPVCYLRLAMSVVTFWSLTQEVAGLNNPFRCKYSLSLTSPNSMKTFRENSIGSQRSVSQAILVFDKVSFILVHKFSSNLQEYNPLQKIRMIRKGMFISF